LITHCISHRAEKVYTPKSNGRGLSSDHDHILVFTKSDEWLESGWNLIPRNEEQQNRFKNSDNDPQGAWRTYPLDVRTENAAKREKYRYEVVLPSGRIVQPAAGRHWALPKEEFEKQRLLEEIYFGKNGDAMPTKKVYLKDANLGVIARTWWAYKDVGGNQDAKKEIITLFDGNAYFDTPKPSSMLKRVLQLATREDDIILDFFSGSATTAHAVMQLNAEDGGNRKFIMVQLPEVCDPKSEAYKAGYKTIAEIGKERIRRAGNKIKAENADKAGIDQLDIGFRVLKVDSSNMKEVYYTPDKLIQGDLDQFTDNILDDRTPEDLLFQVLLDWGVDLTLPITMERMSGKDEGGRLKDGQKAELGRLKDEKGGENSSLNLHPSTFKVFFVDDDALAACFDEDITEAFVKELAARHPMRVVFRDAGFASDSVKINIEQIFKLISPATEIKVI